MTQHDSQKIAQAAAGTGKRQRLVTRMGAPAKDWRRFVAALERAETRLAS